MARVLVPYGTSEGHTAEIADIIAEVLQGRGHHVDCVDVSRLGEALPDRYDAVIVGASIHDGEHDAHVVEFVRDNLDALESMPSAFFSVSLAAHGDAEEAESYVARFEDETGWFPRQVGLFGGALLYTRYGFLKRHAAKRVAENKPGDLGLDTSRDYVYTEWDAVRRFSEHFAERFELTPA